jgi:hypothetical protein
MNRRKAIVGISLASFASAQTKQPAIREKFVGVWKLVSCDSTDKNTGEVRYPYGSSPVGRLTYDAAGRMSAQLMNPGRHAVGGSPTVGSAAAIRSASADDMRAILTGFIAYFGTFDIDESARTVIHHVQACLIPSWVGTDLRRTYEFAGGDQLTLTASSDRVVTRLVWQRESP